jgi:hypothetical protein
LLVALGRNFSIMVNRSGKRRHPSPDPKGTVFSLLPLWMM